MGNEVRWHKALKEPTASLRSNRPRIMLHALVEKTARRRTSKLTNNDRYNDDASSTLSSYQSKLIIILSIKIKTGINIQY